MKEWERVSTNITGGRENHTWLLKYVNVYLTLAKTRIKHIIISIKPTYINTHNTICRCTCTCTQPRTTNGIITYSKAGKNKRQRQRTKERIKNSNTPYINAWNTRYILITSPNLSRFVSVFIRSLFAFSSHVYYTFCNVTWPKMIWQVKNITKKWRIYKTPQNYT